MINNLLDLTWRNPVFIGVAIFAIWFLPGILIRRIAEKRFIKTKSKLQSEKIAKLYPGENKESLD